jgi:flagellar motor switch protein FliN/FliY
MTTIANEIELEPLAESTDDTTVLSAALPFLGAVKVRVSVRVGGTDLSVAELLKMRQGAVMALDRKVEDPLDVLVDDLVIARGILVAVGEHFGVRITETAIASMPAEQA